jgi:hypothetical protein
VCLNRTGALGIDAGDDPDGIGSDHKREVMRENPSPRPADYLLNSGIIDVTQFSLLVTVVVLSAVTPTASAEH